MADEILQKHAAEIESFKMIPSDGGRFEFSVDGELLFSKKALKRHAQPGEVLELFEKHMGS